MTQITAEMVRVLRERSGAGMMDCKKALVASNGDIELAIEALRKSGQASAVKKGSRIAAEGVVTAATAKDNKSAVLAEINCETDFVAREERFKSFSIAIAQEALKNSSESTIGAEEARIELVAQLGENVSVRRIKHIAATDNGVVVAYLHGGDASVARIGVLVALDIDDENLAKGIAMHIAAMRPEFLSEAQVPAERVAKEKEILLAQAQEANVGKPADILEKIIGGKMAKFLKEITLLGQPYVRNQDQTVGALLTAAKANVTDYVRFEVGEGIEKKVDDFVGEVMAQARK